MEKKRSVGITIIGSLLIIWPLLYLLKIPMILLNLDRFFLISRLPDIQKPIFVLQKTLYIICGIGILRLAKLARVFVIYISLFGIVMWVADIILKIHPGLLNKIIHIVVYMSFCWILTRPRVKEQFK